MLLIHMVAIEIKALVTLMYKCTNTLHEVCDIKSIVLESIALGSINDTF